MIMPKRIFQQRVALLLQCNFCSILTIFCSYKCNKISFCNQYSIEWLSYVLIEIYLLFRAKWFLVFRVLKVFSNICLIHQSFRFCSLCSFGINQSVGGIMLSCCVPRTYSVRYKDLDPSCGPSVSLKKMSNRTVK